MAQYRDFSIEVKISDTDIVVTSKIGGYQQSDRVARGGSEVTDFQTVVAAHLAIALSQPPTSTSPPCSVETLGRWTNAMDSGSIGTLTNAIVVPPTNSGVLEFRLEAGSMTYYKNGGSPTAVTNGGTVTVADGDTLSFATTGLGAQETVSGTVFDQDTWLIVDVVSMTNSSIAP